MGVLDIDDNIIKVNNQAKYAQHRVERRNGLSAEEYKRIIDAYYLASESYIDFFNENWCEINLEETNRRIHEAMRKNVSSTFPDNYFSSLEQAKEVAEYVLNSPFPADYDTMQEFFNEVIKGKLEFRCRYPIGDTTAFDLIKGLGKPLWKPQK